ncbi:hypothetical protein LguiA_030075 [Lonicera macranthoides]
MVLFIEKFLPKTLQKRPAAGGSHTVGRTVWLGAAARTCGWGVWLDDLKENQSVHTCLIWFVDLRAQERKHHRKDLLEDRHLMDAVQLVDVNHLEEVFHKSPEIEYTIIV